MRSTNVRSFVNFLPEAGPSPVAEEAVLAPEAWDASSPEFSLEEYLFDREYRWDLVARERAARKAAGG